MLNMFFIDTGISILFLVIFLLLALVAIFFLYRSIKKEKIAFKESQLLKTELTRHDLDEIMNRRFRMGGNRNNFAVFLVVINDAKSMNSSFGELQYKIITRTLMSRYEKVFGDAVKISNASYDSIVVMIDGVFSPKALSDYANFMLIESKKFIPLGAGLKTECDTNIAIASSNEFNKTAEQIWQNLEMTISVSKRSGVNNFMIHTEQLSSMESTEYKNYQEIKEAIDNNEFTLFYQPVVNFKNKEIVAYEGLLRWNHKTMGVLPPNKFLNIIEQTGDINWVGLWAFGEMVSQYNAWKQRHPERKFAVSMNLSRRQMMSETLVDDMRRIMRKYRVEPSVINFEIMESTYFEKIDMIKQNIEKLHQCGFKICIDDYGVELSTLNLLEKFKVDLIKLDRKFVSKAKEDYVSSGIIKVLVDVANKNNIDIVAEGIEDAETMNFVKDLGINLGQGYFFSVPKAANEFER